MCQAGINSSDYKVAIHQLQEHAKLLEKSSNQWSTLTSSAHQKELAEKLKEAAEKAAEVEKILGEAFDKIHDHGHVHIS